MRDSYVKIKKVSMTEPKDLPKSPRGNPLLLGNLDSDVQSWVKNVRLSGGVVNSRILMAAAEAIVTKYAKHKLERYGGHIVITKTWAKSFLRRLGYVKRKNSQTVVFISNRWAPPNILD